MRKLALLPVMLLLAVPAAAQERRAMTTDDGLDMIRVGGAQRRIALPGSVAGRAVESVRVEAGVLEIGFAP